MSAAVAPLIHVVLFSFKPDVSPEKRQELSDKMLALRTNCVHPTSQQPYIKASVGGTDNSIENLQDGMTHAFVVEFETMADRDYYVQQDPVHAAFVKELFPFLSKPLIVDFTPGVFSLDTK